MSDDEEEQDFEDGRNGKLPFKKFCRKCQVFKPKKAHHCSTCNRCVVKMDHHCPWVNNCVGISNHKLFILFCFWTLVCCVITLAVILARFASCLRKSTGEDISEAFHTENDNTLHICPTLWTKVYTFCLLFESVLFGLFTACMLSDQFVSVTSNTTKISRLKNARTHSHAIGIIGIGHSDGVDEDSVIAEESRFLHPDGATEVK